MIEKRIVKIRVSFGSGTYSACGAGERASATAGEEFAARRLAEKVFGETRFTLKYVGTLEEAGSWGSINRRKLYRAEEIRRG
jgi:hypothetical protein